MRTSAEGLYPWPRAAALVSGTTTECDALALAPGERPLASRPSGPGVV